MAHFPKSSRILKKSEFDHLLKQGSSARNANFGIRWQKKPKRRLGIVVSRKVRNATERNRIKRIIRETFRLHPEKFPLGDVIVIAREGSNALSSKAVFNELTALLERKK